MSTIADLSTPSKVPTFSSAKTTTNIVTILFALISDALFVLKTMNFLKPLAPVDDVRVSPLGASEK